MSQYIIVKYRSLLPINATMHEDASVFRTHTAVQCGIEKKTYNSVEEMQSDLRKMRDYNPTADYGPILVDNEGEEYMDPKDDQTDCCG